MSAAHDIEALTETGLFAAVREAGKALDIDDYVSGTFLGNNAVAHHPELDPIAAIANFEGWKKLSDDRKTVGVCVGAVIGALANRAVNSTPTKGGES